MGDRGADDLQEPATARRNCRNNLAIVDFHSTIARLTAFSRPLTQRRLPGPKRLLAGAHVLGDFLKTHGTIVTGVNADVHREEPGVGSIIGAEAPMNVTVEMPGAVEGFIPAPHGIVIEPYLAPLEFDHALIDDATEKRVIRRQIVISPNEIHLTTADSFPVVHCLFERAKRKITHDPNLIFFGDPFIDRRDEGVVMAHDRFALDIPPPTRFG